MKSTLHSVASLLFLATVSGCAADVADTDGAESAETVGQEVSASKSFPKASSAKFPLAGYYKRIESGKPCIDGEVGSVFEVESLANGITLMLAERTVSIFFPGEEGYTPDYVSWRFRRSRATGRDVNFYGLISEGAYGDANRSFVKTWDVGTQAEKAETWSLDGKVLHIADTQLVGGKVRTVGSCAYAPVTPAEASKIVLGAN